MKEAAQACPQGSPSNSLDQTPPCVCLRPQSQG